MPRGREILRLAHKSKPGNYSRYLEVPRAAFSPKGEYLATATGERTVRLWRTVDGLAIACLSHEGDVNARLVKTEIFYPAGPWWIVTSFLLRRDPRNALQRHN